MSWIGERKIKAVVELGDGRVTIGFKDQGETTMNKNLYELVKTEDRRNGNVTDLVYHTLATKILMELAEYGLEFYAAEQIGVALHTLAHNLREEKIGKAFDCKGANDIKISKLLE